MIRQRGPYAAAFAAVPLLAAALSVFAQPATQPASQPATAPAEPELLRTDSLFPYVHRLTLYDHDGKAIDPKEQPAVPYSPRMTCAKCHPYAQIAHGWHFSAPDPNEPAGRPGEPWMLIDERAGAAVPISGRGWPDTLRPPQAGLTPWDMVLHFGHHMPGGGYGEAGGPTPGQKPPGAASDPNPPRDGRAGEGQARSAQQPPSDDLSEFDPAVIEKRAAREAAEAAKKAAGTAGPELAGRWAISGQLEIDCMFCHSADQQHDPAEAARQVEAQNFRWAPTAALGLAVIRGEARKLPDDFDPLAPPSPDYPDRILPKVIWDRTRFDADDRVLFNITRRPKSERCYFCHSFRHVGPATTDDPIESHDVHLAAGLLCVDCHRNALDHRIVRGYDAEAADRGEPWRAVYSCAGCHLGTHDQESESPASAPHGAEGAPATAAAAAEATLGGRYGAPRPQHAGIPPLHFDKLTCTACHSGPWPEMQPKQVQTALAHGLGLATRDRHDDQPPFIAEPVFARQPDGRIAPQRRIQAGPTGGSEPWPYRWSIAHDVRPAGQSLGVRGCTDCHSTTSAFYFGATALPDVQARIAAATMLKLRGENAALQRAWGTGFVFRPAFKWYGFICAGLTALILLRILLDALARPKPPALGIPVPVPEHPETRADLSRLSGFARLVLLASTLVAAATAFGSQWLTGGFGGWALLVHMFAAALFLAGLLATAVLWARRGRFVAAAAGRTTLAAAALWLTLALATVVAGTMLAAMLPLVGTAGQAALIDWHERAAIGLLIMIVVYAVLARAARHARVAG